MAIYHVKKTGNNNNPGTATQPFLTITKGMTVMSAGDEVHVYNGTYNENLDPIGGGTPTAKKTIRSAPGQRATVVGQNLGTLDPNSTSPNPNRAISFVGGVDHWRLLDLDIVGGIYLVSTNIGTLVGADDEWKKRDRSLPGRGVNDPVAAEGIYSHPDINVNPCTGIEIIGCDVRDRGIYSRACNKGIIRNTRVHDILAGGGPGIMINIFSDKWLVEDCDVENMIGGGNHFVSEAFRTGSNSCYNIFRRCRAFHGSGAARGFGQDVNASWSEFEDCYAEDFEINFSIQAGNWGIIYRRCVSRNARANGFSVYNAGSSLTSPNDRSPRYCEMRCCDADQTGGADFKAGSMRDGTIINNKFRSTNLSSNLRSYWGSAGNRWDGSATPPPATNVPITGFNQNCGAAPPEPTVQVMTSQQIPKLDIDSNFPHTQTQTNPLTIWPAGTPAAIGVAGVAAAGLNVGPNERQIVSQIPGATVGVVLPTVSTTPPPPGPEVQVVVDVPAVRTEIVVPATPTTDPPDVTIVVGSLPMELGAVQPSTELTEPPPPVTVVPGSFPFGIEPMAPGIIATQPNVTLVAASVLLDLFAPAPASLAEAPSGQEHAVEPVDIGTKVLVPAIAIQPAPIVIFPCGSFD